KDYVMLGESSAPATGAQSKRHYGGTTAMVWAIIAARLALQVVTAGRYGIFRDELYYFACAEHLSFGYVDQPPLISLVAWLARHLFGDWLIGLRLPAALAGAATIWLAARLARELGGGHFAEALAALAVALDGI